MARNSNYPSDAQEYFVPRCGIKAAEKNKVTYLPPKAAAALGVKGGHPALQFFTPGIDGKPRPNGAMKYFLRPLPMKKHVMGKDLVIEPPIKSLNEPDTHGVLIFPLNGPDWEAIAKDTNEPIVITESATKAYAGCEHGLNCCAPTGVANHVTTIDGVSVDLPDFDLIDWPSRKVFIAFDSDADENLNVDRERIKLAGKLRRRGAKVYYVHIPPAEDGGKQGLDDLLNKGGIEAYNACEVTPASDPTIDELNSKHAVVMVGGKTAVMTEGTDPTTGQRTLTFCRVPDFKNFYANQTVKIKGKDKRICIADHWLQHPLRRTYKGIVFDPTGKSPEDFYNFWQGFAVTPRPGRKHEKLLRHVKDNLAQGSTEIYDYIIAWMAHCVQHPERKRGVALVLRGEEGVGKGIFSRAFGSLFGQAFVHVSDPSQFTGKHNAHLQHAIVVFADEAFWAGDKAAEGALKRMITEPTMMVEPKFVDAFSIANLMHFIIASNNDWVVPAGPDARRFCVVDVGSKRKRDTEYFAAIENDLDNGGRENLLHFLLNYDLSGVDLTKFPRTEALLAQQIQSLSSIDAFWYHRLQSGALLENGDGWTGNVGTTALMTQYADFTGGARTRALETEFGERLKKLCPKMKRKREWVKGTHKRHYIYSFPSLDECRRLFEKFLGMDVQWEVDDA